jgi:hypothetical protein
MSKRRQVMVGLALFLVLAGALAVGLAVGLARPGPSPPPAATENSTTTSTFIVSIKLLERFQEFIPAVFVEAIHNASTPHSRAYEWHRNHPPIEATSEDEAVRRATQRIALASFYYSTGSGVNSAPIAAGGSATSAAAGWLRRDGWLDFNTSECDWYGCTCNTTSGQVRVLNLTKNNLAGQLFVAGIGARAREGSFGERRP